LFWIINVYYLPTDAQLNCLKNYFNPYPANVENMVSS